MSQLQFADDPLEEEHGLVGRPLAETLEVLLRRRWLITICVGAALAVTGIISWLTSPEYRATALLELEKERSNPIEAGLVSGRESGPDADAFATETQLMRNREVAERVVNRSRPLVSPGGSATDVTPTPDPKAVTAAALRLQRNIEVKPVKGTNLIELSFTAESPEKAAELANAVAEAYIDWKLETKFRLLAQASKFLGSQIQEAKQTLAEKEQKLLALGRQKDILSVAPQSSVALQKLSALSQDATAAMAERIGKEARYNELLKASPDAVPEALLTGAIQQMRGDLARLEQEYTQKLNVFKPEWPAMLALKAQIEAAHKNLEVATRESLPKAREAAKAEYQTALRREESLKDALQRQRGEAMTLSRDTVEYNNLRIEVETQRALVDNLLKREAEMQVLLRLQGEKLSNIRIVESALPPGAPFKPSYWKNALLGLLAGLAAGIGLAMTLDSLDRSLRSPEQATRYLRLPVLGVIPPAQAALDRKYGYGYGYTEIPTEQEGRKPSDVKPRKKIPIEMLPHDLPKSGVAEAYRSFRTSLLLSRADGIRTVVITSALPLEGKTSTAINLAIVLGQLGRRVLIVDADLRRPRFHEILNVSNRVGLVSVLAAHTDPGEAILSTPMPNVSVLPAGPLAPDPSGLLQSEAMKRLMSRAVEAFDHVILDSPPVLAVTDAVVLSDLTDGAILCVRAGRTPREKVARARDELLRSGDSILGVVMNNLRDESRTASAAPAYGRPEEGATAGTSPAPRAATAAS
jgi:succinoglycan biosynthesis transport protein ExoP